MATKQKSAICTVLTVLLCTALFFACEASNKEGGRVFLCLDDCQHKDTFYGFDFKDDQIFVVIHESFHSRDFTVRDFKIVNAKEIIGLRPASRFPGRRAMIMLLSNPGRQNVICAVELIKNLEFVYAAEPRFVSGGEQIDGLPLWLRLRIKQDWYVQFGSLTGPFGMPLTNIDYFGTHNGFVAFLGTFPPVPPIPETIYTGPERFKLAGTFFRGPTPTTQWGMYLWKDGYRIFHITWAYRDGLITPENIADIGYRLREAARKGWPGCDESFNEWWFNTADLMFIE